MISFTMVRAFIQKNQWQDIDALVQKDLGVLHQRDAFARSHIWYAAADGQWNVVKELLSRHASPLDALEGLLTFGVTDLKHFKWVVDHIEDINASFASGKKALHLLTQSRLPDTAQALDYLLEKGADPNALDDAGLSALAWGMKRFNRHYCEKLVAAGANLNSKTGKFKNTLAHHAVYWGDLDSIKWLHEKNQSLIETNELAEVPLHRAIEMHRTDIALYLIEQKAGLEAKNRRYKTPLYLAVALGCLDVAKKLLDAGVNAEEKTGKNGQGKSALQLVSTLKSGKDRTVLLPIIEKKALEDLIPWLSSATPVRARSL